MDISRLHGRRILVVEDDSLIRLDVCTALESEGAEITECFRLSRALEIIEKSKLDVAICDIKFGDESSYALIARMFQLRIPVIVYTGYNIRPANFAEPVRVIQKPARESEIVDAVSAAIGTMPPSSPHRAEAVKSPATFPSYCIAFARLRKWAMRSRSASVPSIETQSQVLPKYR